MLNVSDFLKGANRRLRLCKILAGIGFSLISVSSMAGLITDVVTVDNKDWAKPADFLSSTWAEVDTVCPRLSDGICSGTLNGFDMNGWTWASVTDVRSMFEGQYIQPTEWENFSLGADIEFVQNIIGDFGATRHYLDVLEVLDGWSRDLRVADNYSNNYSIWVSVLDCKRTDLDGCDLDAVYDYAAPKTVDDNQVGAWFYRDAISVPEPSSLAIFALGVAGLMVRRKENVK